MEKNYQQVSILSSQSHPLENTPIYATPTPPPNGIPKSWLELSLIGNSLSFNVINEGREVDVVVQNPTFLAQVVGEGMWIAMETYNTHVLMTFILQPPVKYQYPPTPLFHLLTWETPVPQAMDNFSVGMPFLPPIMVAMEWIRYTIHSICTNRVLLHQCWCRGGIWRAQTRP